MKRSKPRVGKSAKIAVTSSAPLSATTTLKIPAILLEGDGPEVPRATPREQRASTKPGSAVAQPSRETSQLPEAYGTGRLLLLPRDPHCVYAHWDLTTTQQRHFNALSIEGHLVLRVHQKDSAGPIVAEIPLPPEARHWFVDVPTAGSQFVVELGCFGPRRHWVSIAVSTPVITPHESACEEKTVHFGVMPAAASRSYPGGQSGIFSTIESDSGPAPREESSSATLGLIKPPRVSWIPALGIEPAGIPSNVADAAPLESSTLGRVPDDLESAEWTLFHEQELQRILGLESFAKNAPSSLEWAQASLIAPSIDVRP